MTVALLSYFVFAQLREGSNFEGMADLIELLEQSGSDISIKVSFNIGELQLFTFYPYMGVM